MADVPDESESSGSEDGNPQDGPTVGPIQHISVKPPVFSPTAVETWFDIIECQFALAKITQNQTKFNHVVGALPADVVYQVPREIFRKSNYDEFKETVIAVYEKSKSEIFHKLISTTSMSGRPSSNLRELLHLAEKAGVGEDIVRHKFIQTLPPSIAPVVASQKNIALTDIGNLADELLPLSKEPLYHVQVNENINPQQQINYTQKHYSQRSDFRPTFTEQYSQQGNSSRPDNNRQKFQRGPTLEQAGYRPSHQNQRPKVCWSHVFYGTRAKFCMPWCQWPEKTSCKLQPNSRSSSPARNQGRGN